MQSFSGASQKVTQNIRNNTFVPSNNLVDGRGHESLISVFGDLIATPRRSDIHQLFQYGVPSFESKTSVTGTGTITTADHTLVLSGGSGTANYSTRGIVRYSAGYGSWIMFTAAFTGSAFIGGLTEDKLEGFHFGNDGNDFCFQLLKAGAVVAEVRRPQWYDTLDGRGKSEFHWNPQYLNIFRVTWGYLGIAPFLLEVYGGTLRGWIPLCEIDLSNSQNTVSIMTPFLPITLHALANGTIRTGCIAGGSYGPLNVQNSRQFAVDNILTATAPVLVPVISIRSKSLFLGGPNYIPFVSSAFKFASDANKNPMFYVIVNGTLTGATIWTDVYTNESSLEYNTNATAITGGNKRFSIPIGKNGQDTIDNIIEEERCLDHDEMITIAVSCTGLGDFSATIHWHEFR